MNKIMKIGTVVIATGLVAIGAMGATGSVTSSVANPPATYQNARIWVGPAPNPDAGN